MTKMIYCTKNNSKTLPFTVDQPYNADTRVTDITRFMATI